MEHERIDSDICTVFVLSGNIEAGTTDRFIHDFKDCFENGSRRMIFDLSGVNFIDSSGIGMLIDAYKISKVKGTELVFTNLSEQVMGLIKLVRLDRFFRIEKNREDVVARFRAESFGG